MGLSDEERERRLVSLMDRYQKSLQRMAYLYPGDIALAEDAVQETFLKAYTHLDGFRGDSSEKTWLVRIAINTCKSVRRGGWMRMLRRSVPPERAPENAGADTYRDDEVIKAVMRLPDKDKQALLLRYYQGMKVTEVAKALNVPEANAASRIKRARDRLRESLRGWYFDEE